MILLWNGLMNEFSHKGSEDQAWNIMKPKVLLALANLFITSYAFFLTVASARISIRQRTQSNNHSNISDLLDNLLRGYDNSIRPDFGGPPATVEVDIMVRSMGPISEVDMTYSMDCYFRQSWVDRRLAFQSGKETLALSISMLARIWKPDTYFYNGKYSYLHTITSPNKFVRLYQDGRVLYSSRLTIKAGCPMNLEDFPMDTQRCPLQFGSFGYTTRDVIYKWNSARQVAIAEDMKLSQFDLVANPTANHSSTPGLSHGITTVLTMTFLGLEARTDLPKVPYPTALDFFVFLSFAFIFATIIQFAVVHYFTKYGSGECYFSSDLSDTDSSSEEEEMARGRRVKNQAARRKSSASSGVRGPTRGGRNFTMNGDGMIEVIPLSAISIPDRDPAMGPHWQISCVTCSPPPRQPPPPPPSKRTTPRPGEKRRRRRTPRYNSVSKIDRASRVVFPLFFLAINLFYWYAYLSRSERMQYYNVVNAA
ncbi:gamma-aminobutyric acid receptor alpha-like isoform X3 [Harpegnathos saltator]|uniref:gamma-aminobutyric acid receptor alpha-like isoform X3 n=1 Tax=Harpegnathos saltator TaxID=610380 RepID=UPI000DBED802|nr:gamma-aminobutyric acid receptor alpha-like isoform X3 [Harpegnathos saltator]